MRLYFKKVRAHNFLSIADIELDLTNRGYVLVEGCNNNPKDNSSSNGSGKSTIFNSICWVLTGETIQGLKTNIPNIYGDDGCLVELTLLVDSDEYVITRYREYKNKNDLKIFINGEDHSGKSLRDSEKLLAQYLPGVTPELIGNVIILGQGLPHKFSNNSPSGRKEILEQLSNSDLMINDVKERVSRRFNALENELRLHEDNNLKLTAELSIIIANRDKIVTQLNDMVPEDQLTVEFTKLKYEVSRLEVELAGDKGIRDSIQIEIDRLNNELNTLFNVKQSTIDEAVFKVDEDITAYNSEYFSLHIKINNLKNEINQLDNVVDTCPTCGQKLPDVHKIDTTARKIELEKLQAYYDKLSSQLADLKYQRESILNNVEMEFKDKLESINNSLKSNKEHLDNSTNIIDESTSTLSNKRAELSKLEAQLDSYRSTKNNLQHTIQELSTREEVLNHDLSTSQIEIENTKDHITTLSQIKTLVNRDFRGLLLSNVIDFINLKSKQYCRVVFDTDDLNLYLDGNNINIDFCGKSLENLSGGEQQKVNIIIQFAIRNMMCQYLNFSSNILVLDEIFDQLDLVGCSNIIDLINAAIQDVESLFVISHHSEELNIPYDDRIIIVKNEQGVSNLK